MSKRFDIEPIEVSHSYNINSTAFVVEASYRVDEAHSKSLIIVRKSEADPIPTNHAQLLNMVTANTQHIIGPEFDPRYQKLKTVNSNYPRNVTGEVRGQFTDDTPDNIV